MQKPAKVAKSEKSLEKLKKIGENWEKLRKFGKSLKSWGGSQQMYFLNDFLMPVKKACFTGILTGPRGKLGQNEEK